MNIILRRCLGMLNMAMIKRKFYDPSGAENVAVNTINILSLFQLEDLIISVCIRQNFNDLTIWPGYFTTIRYHEDCFLLGVDLIFKLQRKDTALKVMYKIKQNHDDDIQVTQFKVYLKCSTVK